MPFPMGPMEKARKLYRIDELGYVIPCNDFNVARKRNKGRQLRIAAWNAFGDWFRLARNQGRYKVPNRDSDAQVYADAPSTLQELFDMSLDDWLELSVFYDFDWDTYRNRRFNNRLMNVQECRAAWASFCGITAFVPRAWTEFN